MPFEPGNTYGKGRPRQKPFIDWCKKWTQERAELFLLPIAEDPKNKGQLEAIKLIMAYAIGKPVESIEADVRQQDTSRDPQEIIRDIGNVLAGGHGKDSSNAAGTGLAGQA